MTSKPASVRWLLGSAILLATSGLWLTTPARAADKKLTDDDRVEILRGLSSEYATVKAYLPRSLKPLPIRSDGTWDKQQWTEAGNKYGPAARLGDLVQITKVGIENDRILLQINGGARQRGNWRDHVQIGMAGPVTGGVTQVDPQRTSAPGGTDLALFFDGPIPSVKSDDIKKMLSGILDFNQSTATENYVEKLPEPIQQAIKSNKVIVGMTRDEVLLAMGKPRQKERNTTNDGTETEDWVYGDPPGKITFVTFANSKVAQVKEAYADIGGSTASPQPVK